ncbi:MAG: IS3 family transposase [Ktedonobacteraceae bacterium]
MITQVRQDNPERPISQLCETLQVSRSWYYEKQIRPEASEADVELRDAIEGIILEFAGYGYRRVTHALKRAGWIVNHKRVLRIMREESLLCHLKRHFVHTTDSQHPYQVYPNLVKGMVIEAPDVVWVADLTYIRLPSTFVYLAAILDAYSRKCIGWKLSKRIDTQLALGALEAALATRHVKAGLIHHSDRGVQYASTEYVARLHSMEAQVSMSAVGNPYDNAKAESFFKTLKREEVYLKQYQTFQEAEDNIRQFIEEVYNTKRLHSSLGYLPPTEFEEAYSLVKETSL